MFRESDVREKFASVKPTSALLFGSNVRFQVKRGAEKFVLLGAHNAIDDIWLWALIRFRLGII